MRFIYYGGIYGKPQTLQLVTATGESITVTGGQAIRAHTALMSIPRGVDRQQELLRLYSAFTADADYLLESDGLDAYFEELNRE